MTSNVSPIERKKYPTNPSSYEWKGTISDNNSVLTALAHCREIKDDVIIKIYKVDDDIDSKETNEFIVRINTLIKMNMECLLTPRSVFLNKQEIWLVYPCISGGPISEILKSHYKTGIPNEKIIACILRDIAVGLTYMHNCEVIHRNIRGDGIYLSREDGKCLLWGFDALKKISFKHNVVGSSQEINKDDLLSENENNNSDNKSNIDNNNKKNENGVIKNQLTQSLHNVLQIKNQEFDTAFIDPQLLHDKNDPQYWFRADIYSFGILALQLAFGYPPLVKNLVKSGINISDVYPDRQNKFSSEFNDLVNQCTREVTSRIKINDLAKHTFFKKYSGSRKDVAQMLGHICKTTASRIDHHLQKPKSFENIYQKPRDEFTVSTTLDHKTIKKYIDEDSKSIRNNGDDGLITLKGFDSFNSNSNNSNSSNNNNNNRIPKTFTITPVSSINPHTNKNKTNNETNEKRNSNSLSESRERKSGGSFSDSSGSNNDRKIINSNITSNQSVLQPIDDKSELTGQTYPQNIQNINKKHQPALSSNTSYSITDNTNHYRQNSLSDGPTLIRTPLGSEMGTTIGRFKVQEGDGRNSRSESHLTRDSPSHTPVGGEREDSVSHSNTLLSDGDDEQQHHSKIFGRFDVRTVTKKEITEDVKKLQSDSQNNVLNGKPNKKGTDNKVNGKVNHKQNGVHKQQNNNNNNQKNKLNDKNNVKNENNNNEKHNTNGKDINNNNNIINNSNQNNKNNSIDSKVVNNEKDSTTKLDNQTKTKHILPKIVSKWTIDDCAYWVAQLETVYQPYADNFRKHAIDGSIFLELDDAMLQEIEIGKKIHRLKIIKEIEKLKE